MSSSPTITKKRKADEISDYATDDMPHLPFTVWGGILDFLPYAEVRSALLVSKSVANDATKYVQTLNIIKAREMYVPATRRFTNISEVNVLALLRPTGEVDEGNSREYYTLSPDAASRTAAFLTSFPKLEKAFIGGHFNMGGRSKTKLSYGNFMDQNDSPGDANTDYRYLVVGLCGVFKTGHLSQNIKLKGIFDEISFAYCRPCSRLYGYRDEDSRGNPCRFCRDVCNTFPLDTLLRRDFLMTMKYSDGGIGSYSCLSSNQFLSLISRRPGGKEAIRKFSEFYLCSLIEKYICSYPFPRNGKSKKIEEMLIHYDAKRLVVHSLRLSFDEFDRLILLGFDPKNISEQYFLDEMNSDALIGKHKGCLHAWKRSTADWLTSRGFPLTHVSIPVTGHGAIPVIDDEEMETGSDEEEVSDDDDVEE